MKRIFWQNELEVYLERDVGSRNSWYSGHEVVSTEGPDDDGPLEGGGPLDVAAIEVEGNEDERHLAQLRGLVAAVQHLIGHEINLKWN